MLGKEQLSITIYKPEPAYFELGGKINKGGKETKIIVEKISVFFSKVTIKLSNGEILIFKGFPVSIAKWKN